MHTILQFAVQVCNFTSYVRSFAKYHILIAILVFLVFHTVYANKETNFEGSCPITSDEVRGERKGELDTDWMYLVNKKFLKI